MPPGMVNANTRSCSAPLQGAKAQQKRERNAAKGAQTAKSQLKVNAAAKNIICATCRQTFVSARSLSLSASLTRICVTAVDHTCPCVSATCCDMCGQCSY